MVASLKVYTPDQVDVPARGDSLSRPQPLYPETLLFTGVPGQVLAEFVVDTLGHVELDTFGVISSTNPKFTQAVQRALPDWAYAPAMLGRQARAAARAAAVHVRGRLRGAATGEPAVAAALGGGRALGVRPTATRRREAIP